MIDLETNQILMEFPLSVKAPDLTSYKYTNNGFDNPDHWDVEFEEVVYLLDEVIDDQACYVYNGEQQVIMDCNGELSDPEFI